MTQNDPTDHALAAIASILDNKESSLSRIADHAVEHHDEETRHSGDAVTLVTERVTVTVVEQETVIAEIEAPATAPEPVEVNGYTRLGPGPLDAIRFRWTARRDEDGQYFVDETIGDSSRPISSGPMPRHDVIAFIDDRETAARERFQTLKRQMTIARYAPDVEFAGGN